MGPDWWTLALSLAAGAAVLALFHWFRFSRHFARRGAHYVPPLPLVGNMLQLLLKRKSMLDVIADLYVKLDQVPFGGVFMFSLPILMVRDPDVVRLVTVKDFDHFTDHMQLVPSGKVNLIWQKMLFSLKGQEWHDMRTTLSPAFTSMKIRNTFVLITEIGQQLVDYLTEMTAEYEVSSGKQGVLTREMRELFTRLTNDVIATAAFGVKVDSLSEPNNTFYCMGRDLTNIKVMKGVGYMVCPKLMEILSISLLDAKAVQFFKSMISETIEMRDKQGIVRHDMLHLMLQARRGELTADEEGKNGAAESNAKRFTDDDVAAQAMLFFLGGFDTVSTVMTFCSYLLATHEDIQERLHQEIDDLMRKTDGKPTYEQVLGCQYLDMVISETLRIYTPGSVVDRVCVRPYRLPASESCPEVELQPGDIIWLPIHGIHRDPKYFPEPERFNPERFSPENKHRIKPFTYFPFGSGPRFCIAQRFALMEMKVLLLYLLSRFALQVVPETPIPLKIQNNSLTISIKGGAWIGIRRRP